MDVTIADRERFRTELREQEAQNTRELRVFDKKLTASKLAQRKIDDEFLKLIVVHNGLTLKDTKENLDALVEMDKRKHTKEREYEKQLLLASGRIATNRISAHKYRLEVLEKQRVDEDKNRLKELSARIKWDSVCIGRKLARLQLLIAQKTTALIAMQIDKLKTDLSVFCVQIGDLQETCDKKSCSMVTEIVMNVSNKVLEMETEFEINEAVNAVRDINEIKTNWSEVSRIVKSL